MFMPFLTSCKDVYVCIKRQTGSFFKLSSFKNSNTYIISIIKLSDIVIFKTFCTFCQLRLDSYSFTYLHNCRHERKLSKQPGKCQIFKSAKKVLCIST